MSATPKHPRGLKVALAIAAVVVIAIAALVGYGLSERGLPFIVARIVAQAGGRVGVEEPTGSITGTMRFKRITWRGADATVVADDVVIDWNPGALWGKRVSIHGLGARHLDIAIKPSSEPTRPPTDLRLPLAVNIDRLAVGELDWRTGPRAGHVSGLEFGYAGDAAPDSRPRPHLELRPAARECRGPCTRAAERRGHGDDRRRRTACRRARRRNAGRSSRPHRHRGQRDAARGNAVAAGGCHTV